MTDQIKELLAEIENYCRKAGIKPRTLSRRAAGTAAFYDRLKNGGDCTFGVASRVRDYMRQNPPVETHERTG